MSTSTAEALIGKHQVLIDRPVTKGGADQGPMGRELFLAGVGACFMSSLLVAIRARDSKISGVRAQVIGTVIDSPARFERLQLFATADGEDREQLPHFVEIADRGCIMMNTFRGKLDVILRISTHRNARNLLPPERSLFSS